MPNPSFQEWKRANPNKSINDYYQELSSGKLNVEQPSSTPISTLNPTINNIYLQNDNGVQEGPFSFEYLKNRKIDSKTLVWFEGMENWVRAGNIPQLQGVLMINYSPPSRPAASSYSYANQVNSNVEDSYFFQNSFGTITNKRVTFFKGGRFGKKTRIDLATKHITYVELTVERKLWNGIFLILIGLIPLYLQFISNVYFFQNLHLKIAAMVIGGLFVVRGIYNIMGSPTIAINTSGNDYHERGYPSSKRKEAITFVSELRNVLFG